MAILTDKEKEEKVEQPLGGGEEKVPASEKRSYESAWGTLLFAVMIVFVLASLSGIGWAVYSQWTKAQDAAARPSIAELPDQEAMTGEAPLPAAEKPETQPAVAEETKTESTLTVKQSDISVLNGGAAKGSAGVLAEILKKNGYTKVTVGNTLLDYQGLVIYYSSGKEKEAEAVKALLAAKYAQTKIAPADTKNKETSTASLTVIVGK